MEENSDEESLMAQIETTYEWLARDTETLKRLLERYKEVTGQTYNDSQPK